MPPAPPNPSSSWLPAAEDVDAVLAWSESMGLSWHRKRSSPLMQTIAVVLALARILPRRVFLDHYTTVLRHRAYAPWAGDPARDASEAWSRIVTVVHEVEHWLQWQREPWLRFPILYLLSQRARARWEAQAYACNQELAAWRCDPIPDVGRLAARLEEYGCGPAARDEARKLLDASAARAAEAPGDTEAVRRVLPLLEKRREGTRSARSG